MRNTMQDLWAAALEGNKNAYRKLGIRFWKGSLCRKNEHLAALCFEKAAELGDEKGYYLYGRLCAKKKKMIDDNSYRDMSRDYLASKDRKERKRLLLFLSLGTKVQKQIMSNKRCK